MIAGMLIRKIISILLLCLNSTGCGTGSQVPAVPLEDVRTHISRMGVQPTDHIVVVDIEKQTLALMVQNQVQQMYTISTSKRGPGQKVDTFKTPLGLHRIHEKIGDGIPAYGIFHRRQFVGVWQPRPRHQHLKDFVSTRILRLEGLQPGFNRGRDRWGRIVDTEQRAVYIHGTTMEWKLGAPSTKGCVHMRAEDVIRLFNSVPVGTLVWIN